MTIMTVTTGTETTTTEAVAGSDAEVYTFEKGTWQHTLQLSAQAEDKSLKAKVLAGRRLWLGTVAAVTEFTDPTNDTTATDPSGEYLAAAIKPTGLSASAISKIKNVALAARDREDFDFEAVASEDKMSLDKADKRVRALLKAEAQPEVEAAEDSAVDAAIQAVAEVAPKTSNTVEGNLQIALAKAGDVEEFVKVLIDVLNGPTKEHNPAACQAFIRAFAAENGGRVKESKPEKVTVAQRNAAKRAAAPTGDGASKPKPAQQVPVQTDKTKTALPPRAASTETVDPVDPAVAENAVDSSDEDLWDDVDTEVPAETPVPTPVQKAKPVKKATPIKRA